MSKYDEIMDRVSLSDESRERILQKTKKAASKYGEPNPDSRRARLIKYLALAACFVLLLSGSFVLFRDSRKESGVNSMESANKEEYLYDADADQEQANLAGVDRDGDNQADTDREETGQAGKDQTGSGKVVNESDFKTIRIIAMVIIVLGLALSGYLHFRRLTRLYQEKHPDVETGSSPDISSPGDEDKSS